MRQVSDLAAREPAEPAPPLAPGPTHRARGRARLLMLASAACFGLSAMLTRLANGAGLSGGQASLIRFCLGLALVLALFRLRPGTFRPARPGLLAVRGLVGGLSAALYYVCLQLTSAGLATLLNNLYPFFAVALSVVLLGERPTLHLGLALLVTGAGVFLVLGGGHATFALSGGALIGLLSALCGGIAVTAIRVLRATVNAPTIFSAFSVGGVLVSIPLARGGWPSAPGAWLLALGVGVSAFFAQLCMTEAYGALAIPEAALWQMLTPLAAYLFGLCLGEPMTWATVLGVLLGAGGIAYGSVLGYAPRAGVPAKAAAPAVPGEEM